MRAGPEIICLMASFLVAAPAAAGPRGWSWASDVGRDALVTAALGVPAVQGDWHGDVDAAVSLLAAGGTTYALKESGCERRPNGSDDRSFPSGHIAVSFAAAATLEKRYGWSFGAPASAVATLVSVSRVTADKHYVHDVLAGAAIGWAAHGGEGVTFSARW